MNNAYVSCTNHGRDVHAYLRALPLAAVGEIHLAGFAQEVDSLGAPLLIDSHGAPVADAVWALYDEALALTGPVATARTRQRFAAVDSAAGRGTAGRPAARYLPQPRAGGSMSGQLRRPFAAALLKPAAPCPQGW